MGETTIVLPAAIAAIALIVVLIEETRHRRIATRGVYTKGFGDGSRLSPVKSSKTTVSQCDTGANRFLIS